MTKSKKKVPVTIRLRDLKRLDPCDGALETAREVFGAEPILDSNLAVLAAEHNIMIPWVSKALSPHTNYEIGLKLARKATLLLLKITNYPIRENALNQVLLILRRTTTTNEDLMRLRMKLNVVFNQHNMRSIVKNGFEALMASLTYMETSSENRAEHTMLQAVLAVDKLASVEATMLAEKLKIPLYELFIDGLAEEKRERILRRSFKKKAVPAKAKSVPCKVRKKPVTKKAKAKKK